MAKKLFRSMTLGIVVFAVAILAGYLAYGWTYRYQTRKLQETLAESREASAETLPMESRGTVGIPVDYYLAKLERRKVVIYTVTEGEPTFLYTLTADTTDFPAADLVRLQEGVILRTRQELASFEEDYGS